MIKILPGFVMAFVMALMMSTSVFAHVYEGLPGDGYSPPILGVDDPVTLPVEPDPVPTDVDGIYIASVDDADVVLSIHSEGDTYVMFVLNNDHILFDTYVGKIGNFGAVIFSTYDDYSSVQGVISLRFRPDGGVYGVQTACFEIFDSHACLFDNGTEFLGEKVF